MKINEWTKIKKWAEKVGMVPEVSDGTDGLPIASKMKPSLSTDGELVMHRLLGKHDFQLAKNEKGYILKKCVSCGEIRGGDLNSNIYAHTRGAIYLRSRG